MTVPHSRSPLLALLVLAACARAPLVEQSAGAVAPAAIAAVTVREIPLSTASDLARSHFLLGERLLDAGRPQLAASHFRAAVAQDPSFAYAWVNLAVSAQSVREFKESLDMAARQLAGATVAESLFVRIGRTFLDNDLEEQLELAQTLTRVYPDVARAWLVLGNTHVALNHHAEARRAFRRATSLDARLFAAHAALGSSYLFGEPRDRAMALQSMEQAIAVAATAPQRARGYELLGDVHRAVSRLAEARDAYRRATGEDSTHAVATLKQGHIESFLGNFDDARAAYDAALAGAKGGQRIGYANYRAFTWVHADDPRAAIAELRAIAARSGALDVPPAELPGLRAFTYANAATIGLHHDLVDDAGRDIGELAAAMRADAAATADSSYARQQEAAILLWEGRLAARRGDIALARRKAEAHRALVFADRNPRRLEGYHALLGLTAMRDHDAVKAVEEYRQADLTDDYVRYQLAIALEASGNTEEAKRIFREVAEWNFNSVGFALSRRDAMRRGGVMTMK
jgi:tetratricopeptide (TPR) repeat protein